jgi:predicted nucleotidyltransferase
MTFRLPSNIHERIPIAAQYLRSRKDVCFAYLFGGLAKGRPSPISDIDIAIYLTEDADIIESRLEILENLADVLNTDAIDLIVLNHASLSLSMNILKNNKILVDKKPSVRHVYQSLIMRKYFDYHYLESEILERRFYHGR